MAGNVADAVLHGTVQDVILAIDMIGQTAAKIRRVGRLVNRYVECVVVLHTGLLRSTEYEHQKARS
jgi:hypothetical protein